MTLGSLNISQNQDYHDYHDNYHRDYHNANHDYHEIDTYSLFENIVSLKCLWLQLARKHPKGTELEAFLVDHLLNRLLYFYPTYCPYKTATKQLMGQTDWN